MKLSVPRSSAYNLASGTQRRRDGGWRGPRGPRGLGNTSLYDHCPQCRVLATRPHRDIYRPAAALPLPPRSALSPPLENRDFHRNLAESRARDLRDATPRVPFGKRQEKQEGGNFSRNAIDGESKKWRRFRFSLG